MNTFLGTKFTILMFSLILLVLGAAFTLTILFPRWYLVFAILGGFGLTAVALFMTFIAPRLTINTEVLSSIVEAKKAAPILKKMSDFYKVRIAQGVALVAIIECVFLGLRFGVQAALLGSMVALGFFMRYYIYFLRQHSVTEKYGESLAGAQRTQEWMFIKYYVIGLMAAVVFTILLYFFYFRPIIQSLKW